MAAVDDGRMSMAGVGATPVCSANDVSLCSSLGSEPVAGTFGLAGGVTLTNVGIWIERTGLSAEDAAMPDLVLGTKYHVGLETIRGHCERSSFCNETTSERASKSKLVFKVDTCECTEWHSMRCKCM